MLQTILGAISIKLAKYTSQIRLVSRNPKKINSKGKLFQSDLLTLHK